MKEKIEEFKKGNLVINTRTQEEYDKLMSIFDEYDLSWQCDRKKKKNHWIKDEENTCIICITINLRSYIYRVSINYIDNTIITFQDFIKDTQDEDIKLKQDDKITLKNEYAIAKSYKIDSPEGGFIKDFEKIYECTILKVERPEYKTIYEKKEEILDKEEKEYLSAVIKPFRNRIRFIEKNMIFVKNVYYIFGTLRNNDTFSLPTFKNKNMYKNMELNKKYTLEELGL